MAENFEGPPKKLDDALTAVVAGRLGRGFQGGQPRNSTACNSSSCCSTTRPTPFKATIDIKPDYDFGNNNLGVYYARKARPEDLTLAEKYFSGALMSNQRYADAYNNLGIILAGQGKFDEAIACHKAGLGVRDDRASDHNNLCRVYMQKDDR